MIFPVPAIHLPVGLPTVTDAAGGGELLLGLPGWPGRGVRRLS